jgi:hypothetical protein
MIWSAAGHENRAMAVTLSYLVQRTLRCESAPIADSVPAKHRTGASCFAYRMSSYGSRCRVPPRLLGSVLAFPETGRIRRVPYGRSLIARPSCRVRYSLLRRRLLLVKDKILDGSIVSFKAFSHKKTVSR